MTKTFNYKVVLKYNDEIIDTVGYYTDRQTAEQLAEHLDMNDPVDKYHHEVIDIKEVQSGEQQRQRDQV